MTQNKQSGDKGIKFRLKLYIVGESESSLTALNNLRSLLEEKFKDQYKLDVINVLERQQLAENDKILATPTVIKYLPEPVKRIIGDLSNRDKVLLGLDLVEL